MSVTEQQAKAAAHAAVWQATQGPRTNVTNLRARSPKPYDGQLDEIRSAALDVTTWSLLLAAAEHHDVQAVREAGAQLRQRLLHPCALIPTDSDPTGLGMERPVQS